MYIIYCVSYWPKSIFADFNITCYEYMQFCLHKNAVDTIANMMPE